MKFTNGIVIDDASTKLHKNVSIACSGIYQYHYRELPGMGVGDVPQKHRDKRVFNVYRPATVLKDAVPLFVRLPLTREHPSDFVDPENFRDVVIGWTGDSSDLQLLDEDNGKFTIKSTLNILDKEGISAYNSGVKEVSPGYVASFKWEDGVSPDGVHYQIEMTKIEEVNHLALVDNGRGGKDASITDSKGVQDMDEKSVLNMIKNLFKKEKTLDSIPKNGENLTDDQIKYVNKEMVRLLNHRASGKSMDSFLPEGFTRDEFPEEKEEESKDAFPDTEEKEEESKDAFPDTEEKEESKDSEEESKDSEEEKETSDAPAEQSAVPIPSKPADKTTGGEPEGSLIAKSHDSDVTVKIGTTDSASGKNPFDELDSIFSTKKEKK
jgi:hypothetical protein